MTLRETFMGALLLRRQTFVALRERSDVFLRGFLVLLAAGLIVGLFMGLEGAVARSVPPPSKDAVIAQALANFDDRYRGDAETRALIEPFITEGVSMVYEIMALTPRGGELARPVATILELIGTTLALPFSWAWAGWLLFAGLLFHLTSRWLGGRAGIAQMLGLTALAAAPQILLALGALFGILQTLAGAPLGFLVSIIGFLAAIWSAVVYIQAVSVAQGFSWLRAIGAIALGYVVLIGVFIALVVLFGLLVSLFVVPIAGAIH